MNFILDGMLGKLARWLRMMGHDTHYSTEMTDAELLSSASAENRILLTRDLQLFQQAASRGVQAYYVEGTSEPERLAELAKLIGIPIEIDLAQSRCPKCNAKISPASLEEIVGKVEKNTLIHYSEFWRCPNCDAVYWQGAHWTKIHATLQEAKEIRKERSLADH